MTKNYFAGFGSGESVKITRKTSWFNANLEFNCAMIVSGALKMTFA
jgi:hypothetical protein